VLRIFWTATALGLVLLVLEDGYDLTHSDALLASVDAKNNSTTGAFAGAGLMLADFCELVVALVTLGVLVASVDGLFRCRPWALTATRGALLPLAIGWGPLSLMSLARLPGCTADPHCLGPAYGAMPGWHHIALVAGPVLATAGAMATATLLFISRVERDFVPAPA
jgi:hypothetical protein